MTLARVTDFAFFLVLTEARGKNGIKKNDEPNEGMDPACQKMAEIPFTDDFFKTGDDTPKGTLPCPRMSTSLTIR